MDKVIKLIREAGSVVILPHVHSDGDAVGSCKAMSELLKTLGKSSVIYAEEAVEQRLGFISEGVEVYSGTEETFDTCIALDCGDMERLGSRAALAEKAKQVINIDHHKTNTFFGDANYVDAKASATGEILTELYQRMGIAIGKEAARYLYTAICSDTGCFAYSNTSPETMRKAALLMETGIDHAETARLLFDSVPLETELLKAELTGKIRSYFGGRLRVVSVSSAMAEKYGLDMEDVSDIVNIPRRICGTEIAASIKDVNGKIRVSLRSNGTADVAAAAQQFGGGGHTKAAGCTVGAADMAEAEELVVRVCGELLK